MSKKARATVVTLFIAVLLMIRVVGDAISPATINHHKQQIPFEVPYSTFLDTVEMSGNKYNSMTGKSDVKGEIFGIDQVAISRDRIGFSFGGPVQISPETNVKPVTPKYKPFSRLTPSHRSSSAEPVVPFTRAYTMKPSATPELIDLLRRKSIPFAAVQDKNSRPYANLARAFFVIVYAAFLLRMYRTMGGGGKIGGGKGDSPGRLADKIPTVKFDDVEGVDAAKFEVMELVDALRNPKKYEVLGARAPTGILLEGPPGTGKTMLAKACASAAAIPLLYCSGSDFVEMFVGRGAARVRQTFAKAAKMSPCIIFIDELDALGKSRGGVGGGLSYRSNDEAEQTLNQLLACMDGLESTRGICVLAATNRREVLDMALVRPGRFDRIVRVDLPDVRGRENILRVHARKLPGFKEGQGVDERRLGSLGIGSVVDLGAVAAVTSGFSGADLEFIVNEAAIRAVRRVSAELRKRSDIDGSDILGENETPIQVVPTVQAMDFEESVKNYFQTRGTNGGAKMGEMLNNVFKN